MPFVNKSRSTILPIVAVFGISVSSIALATISLSDSAVQVAPDWHNQLQSPAQPARADLTANDRKRVANITKSTSDFSKPERFENMQGGAATSTKLVNRNAFSNPSANLSFEQQQEFALGDALFEKFWVSSPSSTQASDGLGPLYNARSCQSCHVKDGRGHPPEDSSDAISMFLRLARPAHTAAEQAELDSLTIATLDDPTYGGQLQDIAVPGLHAEGQMQITYEEFEVTLDDGEIVKLRKPTYAATELAYGALHPNSTLSPRIANPMIGLGLLEAIHRDDILSGVDPEDKDQDGISGRAAFVRDPQTGEVELGRFGWKAQNASIRTQSAKAFAGDIGLSTPETLAHYGDCTEAQTACFEFPTGVQENLGDSEAPDPVLELVTFYAQNLAVPQRRNVDDPQVLQGKQNFYRAGCTSCHTPKFVTSRDAINDVHAFQLIWPYSDMLLHDMGEGLADGQRVGLASGSEWRTPPLWGIGLTETVNEHTFFLHDGRARNLSEAILWHGGEAQQARDNFAAMAKADRDALIAFLESL